MPVLIYDSAQPTISDRRKPNLRLAAQLTVMIVTIAVVFFAFGFYVASLEAAQAVTK